MEQIEREWHEKRKTGYGSSDSPPIVLGHVYDTYPLDVYLDKVSPVREMEDKAHFRRGHTYESLAVTLFAEQTGIKVFSPRSDAERFRDFQLFHPGDVHALADLDAFCEDNWVLEAKCPTQRTFERIVAEGLEDYYQVQSHHLAGVAAESQLPFLGNERVEIKGTRVVVYAPEDVSIIIVEIPFDRSASEDIFHICEAWWKKHVIPRVPPTSQVEPEMELKRVGGDYVQVDDPELEDLVQKMIMAREFAKGATGYADKIKGQVKTKLTTLGLKKVIVPSGVKLLWDERNGQKRLDRKALQAEHPEVDVDKYMVRGKPSRPFNVYGATQYGFEVDMDPGILANELHNFPLRQLDPGVREQEWARLEAHATAYLDSYDENSMAIQTALSVAREVIEKNSH